ncbi:hypothetical protein M9H77_31541 [Catharanthus roseus]|uniref:Uncharacterized protein n=1 Tax=Catharanthus roseus TaxID=4058 RepID=A0ACC0A0R4_CATRO|nr:hypothetical protein M9H77_31541 [Catharanthus roseus]
MKKYFTLQTSCFNVFWAYFIFFIIFTSPTFSAPLWLGNNVTLFGDASIDNNSIRLTQSHSCGSPPPRSPSSSATVSGVGRAFYVNPIRFLDSSINSTASFSCSFTFIIVSTPSCPFGDGLAFLITSNMNYLSIDDGCMGLPEEANDQDSFVAVEFDTSYNPDLDDINGNHIGVNLNQIKSLASVDVVSRGIDLKGGKEMTAWIEYRHSEKMIRVWVGYSQVRPLNPILVTQLDLSIHFKEFMHVGFSASSGKGSAIQSVHSWRFKTFWFRSPTTLPMDIVEEGDCLMCFPEDASLSNDSSSNRMKSKLGFFLILGGSAAFIVFASVVLVFVILCLRRKRRSNRRCSRYQIGGFHRVPKYLSLSEIREATKGFNQDKIIGEGASAVVYEGEIPSCGSVAVKRFNQGKRIGVSQNTFDTVTRVPFDNEFATMVGCLRHKNLVQLKGWCCERNELVLVYEYMANGSLDKILHRHTSITKFLTWDRRRNILLGVASALIYLHEECDFGVEKEKGEKKNKIARNYNPYIVW